MVDNKHYGYRSVNVMAPRVDRNSLLTWFTRLISVRRECPEIGAGRASLVDVALPRGVIAHRMDAASGSLLFLHNLSGSPATADLPDVAGADGIEELCRDDDDGPPVDEKLRGIELQAYGYRWVRRRPSPDLTVVNSLVIMHKCRDQITAVPARDHVGRAVAVALATPTGRRPRWSDRPGRGIM